MSLPLAKFKAEASKSKRSLTGPGISLDAFRDILRFLRHNNLYSTDVDYADLCESFTRQLRRIVNPYRHRTILETYREPAELNEIRSWLEIWVEALTTLPCSAATVPDWHRTYDVALFHALSALVRQRKSHLAPAAEGWTEAATICREWLNRNHTHRETPEYRMLEADYHFFDARAYRVRAQSALDHKPRTSSDFDEIASLFATGLHHMQESNAITKALREKEIAKPTPVSELVQLEYFTDLCKYRSALLRSDFPNASMLLDNLVKLAPITRMKHLPYFDQAQDANLERYFLEAFQALARGDIPGARRSMENLVAGIERDSSDTIRSKWLRLRCFATQILDGDSSVLSEVESLCGSGLGLGQATRFIKEVCDRLVRREVDAEEARERLLTVFPLDAFPPTSEYKTPTGVESLDWMPSLYRSWLEDLPPNEIGKGRLLFLQWQYVANIAEYLCGLYRVKRARGEIPSAALNIPSDFRLLGFKELKDLLDSLRAAIDWTGKDLAELIAWIDRPDGPNLPRKKADPQIQSFAKNFRECVAASSKALFPQVVRVLSQERLADGKISVKLERLWRLPPRHLELVCFGAKGLRDGEYYFLKAPFKRKLGVRYDEELQEIFNFHQASTLALPPSSGRFCLLVEGRHDEYVFRSVLDAFLPYWEAQIHLRVGGGDSLPDEWQKLKGEGYAVVVIADADKKGRWDWLSPFWLTPDFEGVDVQTLAEAVRKLWGDSIGSVAPTIIEEVVKSTEYAGNTASKLRSYFHKTTRTFSVPDENEMKRHLRGCISGIWIRRRRIPPEIAAPLLNLAEQAFCLRPPNAVPA